MEKEARKIKTVVAANIKLFEADKFDTLLEKCNLWKLLRITSWISRFVNNVRRTKLKDPLTTEELINQQKFWTKREQLGYKNDKKFKSDTEHLNLRKHKRYLRMSRKNTRSLSCLSTIKIFTE